VPLQPRFLDPTLSGFSFPLPGIEHQLEGATGHRVFLPVTPTGATYDWTLPGPQNESGQAQGGVRGLTGQRAALLAKSQIADPGETRDGLLNLAGHFPDPVTQGYRPASTVSQKDRGWMRYSLGSIADDLFYFSD
jgi:hypothetical protein